MDSDRDFYSVKLMSVAGARIPGCPVAGLSYRQGPPTAVDALKEHLDDEAPERPLTLEREYEVRNITRSTSHMFGVRPAKDPGKIPYIIDVL